MNFHMETAMFPYGNIAVMVRSITMIESTILFYNILKI